MSRSLALTLGEPAGIGPDITLTAWTRRAELGLPAFYVLADPQCLSRRAGRLGLDVPLEVVTPQTAAEAFARALPVVALGIEATAEPGQPNATSAPAAIASIDRAVADVMAGLASAVVTNPVAKSVLYKAGFSDPGHTEYLARLSFERTGNPAWPVMMLWSPEVAVVPVTIHVPFKEVPQRLTRDLIFETGRVVARDLIERFGIVQPRLAVAGLNPHAGEDGTLGKEDSLVVRPAIERLIADGIDARGPLSADTMFHEAARKTYDAALCMYHDQALIPIKTLAFDHGVNVTLGLPFVRTSPDHGTAFDIAGSGKADPSSLVAALKLAARLAAADQDRSGRRPQQAHDPEKRNPVFGKDHAQIKSAKIKSAMSDLPPLRDVIRRHGLAAKKSLGQNFLLDLNLTGRIARAAGPLAGATVLEIGPGPGGLTRALLTEGAKRVIAIERDERAIAALEEIAAHFPGRLTIVTGDALEIDPKPLLDGAPARIVANLPYNIATALLVSWLTAEPWPPWYERMVLMFQREVAERIVAPPGSKTYGRLSVLAGWRTEAKILFDVHPSNFVPPPKVTSSVVEFIPRQTPLACDRRLLERVTEAAFGQRRKMLRQSLRTLTPDPLPLLAQAGIEQTARAEEIPVEGFVALARAFQTAGA